VLDVIAVITIPLARRSGSRLPGPPKPGTKIHSWLPRQLLYQPAQKWISGGIASQLISVIGDR
jgi:hypothetical protein